MLVRLSGVSRPGRAHLGRCGAELEYCPVSDDGKRSSRLAEAASWGTSLQILRICAYVASGDVVLGAAVIRRCEADFLLSRRQKRTYRRELERCWLKYRRQPGTLYLSFEAMWAAGMAQAYARRFGKAGR